METADSRTLIKTELQTGVRLPAYAGRVFKAELQQLGKNGSALFSILVKKDSIIPWRWRRVSTELMDWNRVRLFFKNGGYRPSVELKPAITAKQWFPEEI